MPKVVSSMMYRIDYDKAARALGITFMSGKNYTYFDVPQKVYADFLKAESKGAFFNGNIKDEYRFTEARPPRRR